MKSAVLGTGKMMGPALYRNALQLLLLDRVFLEEYFGDRINLEATTKDYQLNVTITNTYAHPVSGTLELVLAPELKMNRCPYNTGDLPANTTKTLAVCPESAGKCNE